jgi:hypothetical protein
MDSRFVPVAVVLLVANVAVSMASGVEHGAGSAASVLSFAGTSVRAVRLVSEGAAASITVEADGPLPLPRVGVLSDPPRIYLDFVGVVAATEGLRADGNPVIRGVRVAMNGTDPLVTRVVIDLVQPMRHHVDATHRDRGQITVEVGSPSAQPRVTVSEIPPQQAATATRAPNSRPVPPPPPPTTASKAGGATPPAATPVPPPKAPATSVPPAAQAPAAARDTQQGKPPAFLSARPAPPPPSRPAAGKTARADLFAEFSRNAVAAGIKGSAEDIVKYLDLMSPAIDALDREQAFLASLDALAVLPDEQLREAAKEFLLLRLMMTTVEPPASLKGTHEVFSKACELGAVAATTLLDRAGADDATRRWSAAAAAAGSIMLLERARGDLGLVPIQKQP